MVRLSKDFLLQILVFLFKTFPQGRVLSQSIA